MKEVEIGNGRKKVRIHMRLYPDIKKPHIFQDIIRDVDLSERKVYDIPFSGAMLDDILNEIGWELRLIFQSKRATIVVPKTNSTRTHTIMGNWKLTIIGMEVTK